MTASNTPTPGRASARSPFFDHERNSEMKVKVISRSEQEQTRERRSDLRKVHRNYDPQLHPFEKQREVRL